jgi:O-antigen/teichoic acid export membrane protein
LNVLVYGIYEESLIRSLSLILGFNIVFDNIIYVFKSINIAFNTQKKTFYITSLEALFKLIAAIIIWQNGMNILAVVFIIIFLRLFTLFCFFKWGLPDHFNLTLYPIKLASYLIQLVEVVLQNRYFILIGTISVFFWSIGNIIVSKVIGLNAVPVYEISFKLFSMSEVIPLMVSSSVFPVLVQKSKFDLGGRNAYYRKMFQLYAAYGIIAFSFIYFFADWFIPFLFGNQFEHTSTFVKEIFLTMLLFPTALLQANLIISMGYEKVDMWFNLVSLIVNIAFSLIGLYFFNSLSIINYSIFISFWIFHILQDIMLIKNGVSSKREAFLFHLLIIAIISIFFASKKSIFIYIS